MRTVDLRSKIAAAPAPRRHKEPEAPSSSWVIGNDPEASPQMIYRRCIYYREKKIVCRQEGFTGVVASPDGQRAIGFGGISEDRRRQAIIAMESNGTITRRWDFDDASAFVGRAAPAADLFVALYGPSLGPLKLFALSFSGTPKWEKTFIGASLRHVAPESLAVSPDGTYTLASITEAVIVLDRAGQEVRRYKNVRMAQMSPDGRHALMWGPGKLMTDALDDSNPSEWETSDQEATPIRGGDFSEDGERVCIVRTKNLDGSRQVSSVILIDIPAKSSARAMPTIPLKLKSKASCRYSRGDVEVSLDTETLHFNAP